MLDSNEFIFAKGDRVLIKSCSEGIPDMEKRVGAIVTIKSLRTGFWRGTEYRCYTIEEDGERWFWREDWLTPEKNISISEDEISSLFH